MLALDLQVHTNRGCSMLNMDSAMIGIARTVVAVGIPRSGTTMIARLMERLGLLVPDAADAVFAEDTELSTLLDTGNEAALIELIARRNAARGIWGFKRPEAYKHMATLDRLLRNPRYIVMFRDILAISVRNELSVAQEVGHGLRTTARQQQELVEAVLSTKSPVLLMSYEKCLAFPTSAIKAVASFCGAELDDEQVAQLLPVISANDAGYIRGSRAVYEGHIDRLVNGTLFGWARRVDVEQELNVEILVNDTVVAKGLAATERPDLAASGIGSGRYGFAIKLPAGFPPGVAIQARVVRTNFWLKGSGSSAERLADNPGRLPAGKNTGAAA